MWQQREDRKSSVTRIEAVEHNTGGQRIRAEFVWLTKLILFGGRPSGFYELPEFGVILEGFVFARGKTGSEEKVFEGIAVEDAVDHDSEFMAFEIDAVIAQSESMQGAPGLLH